MILSCKLRQTFCVIVFLFVIHVLTGCLFPSSNIIVPDPLYRAIEEGRLGDAKTMIQEGYPLTADPRDGNLLHAAVNSHDSQLIEYVMSLGLDMECKNKYGETALHCSDLPMMKALLERGANINTVNNQGITAFFFKGTLLDEDYSKLFFEKLDLLLKYGANINETHDKETLLDYWMRSREEARKPYSFSPGTQYHIDQWWEEKKKLMIPFLRERGAKTYQEIQYMKKIKSE